MEIYKRKSEVVKAIKFDIEKWLYERQDAYPMVRTADCKVGKGVLGGMFGYQPVINTVVGDLAVRDGDYIYKDETGNYYSCRPAVFFSIYEVPDDKKIVKCECGKKSHRKIAEFCSNCGKKLER